MSTGFLFISLLHYLFVHTASMVLMSGLCPVVWLPLATVPALCSRLHTIKLAASGWLPCWYWLFLFVYRWGKLQAHSLHWFRQKNPTITTICGELLGNVAHIAPISSACLVPATDSHRESRGWFIFGGSRDASRRQSRLRVAWNTVHSSDSRQNCCEVPRWREENNTSARSCLQFFHCP